MIGNENTLFGEQTVMNKDIRVPLQIVITSLGEGNVGSLGPNDLTTEQRQQVINDLAHPEYSVTASNRWICVDGRLCQAELEAVDSTSEIADPQTSGGKVLSDMAARLMGDPEDHKLVSQLATILTRENIEDNIRVTVHGDTTKHKEGCKANASMREALSFNAENADIVAPIAWSVGRALGLNEWLQEDDVVTSIVNGKTAAEHTETWDVSAVEIRDIIVANGGEYIELEADHNEKAIRIDTTVGAFAKAKYVRDHSNVEQIIQSFSASLGCYKKVTFEIAQKRGLTEREAALQTLRVILFNLGLSKILSNEEMPVCVVSKSF
jgi:hypothetical protein